MAFATMVGLPSAASADTMTTTTNTVACDSIECSSFNTSVAALKPFDASLGTLTGITLQVNASTTTSYNLSFTDGQFTQQSGTAQLSYDSPFEVVVNGVSYSFDVTGAQSLSYTGLPTFTPLTFAATGSATFNLDASLFASFTGSSLCNIFRAPSSGVCVTGDAEIVPTFAEIVDTSTNLVFSYANPGPAILRNASYTLTYTYS
ncbi:MAG TPA: choice-of-anchor E domain-containing protein, partial [Sphingomicrobium sp.]